MYGIYRYMDIFPHNSIGIGTVGFVVRYNKLLLGKRKGFGDGSWGLPGGDLEYGETLTGAAKRELLEETAIKADNLSFLFVVNDPREEDHYVHFCFLLENVNRDPQLMEPEECHVWEWFDLHNLPKEIFFGHQRLVSAFFEKQIFIDPI